MELIKTPTQHSNDHLGHRTSWRVRRRAAPNPRCDSEDLPEVRVWLGPVKHGWLEAMDHRFIGEFPMTTSIYNSGIFHCHVWVPEGTRLDIVEYHDHGYRMLHTLTLIVVSIMTMINMVHHGANKERSLIILINIIHGYRIALQHKKNKENTWR